MIETLRRFGFAARFASGYLYAPGGDARGAGATHAWCDVYLPDSGWLEFDPTNGIAESRDLIRVASTRTPQEAAPVSGATAKPVSASLTVNVDVDLIG
jgi:transglutaminase-like putative cysteine protease